MKNNICLVIFMFFFSCQADMQSDWTRMQRTYRDLVNGVESYKKIYSQLVHDDWQAKSRELKKYLLGAPVESFLLHPILKGSMVRKHQRANPELDYVLNQAQTSTRDLLLQFQEQYVGGLIKSVHDVNCSPNSLAAMYFLSRATDYYAKPINTVIEFGGGFGSLACLAKSTIPKITYIIIDLPEITAIQSLYLRKIIPEAVKVHITAPLNLEQGYIHLVPVYLLNEIKVESVDLFLSTFAITESTLFAQKTVGQINNFFNAQSCYIVGFSNSKWVAPDSLINMIKKTYPKNIKQPYFGNKNYYEIRAKRG